MEGGEDAEERGWKGEMTGRQKEREREMVAMQRDGKGGKGGKMERRDWERKKNIREGRRWHEKERRVIKDRKCK